jgi:hypothetical protein
MAPVGSALLFPVIILGPALMARTDQHKQNLVRDKRSGRGLLYPDTFAEERLVLVPPAATALLVLFNRNHNVHVPPVPLPFPFPFPFHFHSPPSTSCQKLITMAVHREDAT